MIPTGLLEPQYTLRRSSDVTTANRLAKLSMTPCEQRAYDAGSNRKG
jgi:hypothetical protein